MGDHWNQRHTVLVGKVVEWSARYGMLSCGEQGLMGAVLRLLSVRQAREAALRLMACLEFIVAMSPS